MRIATVNVNGVRAAARKGFNEWLATTPVDVVCLQEVRAPDEVVRAAYQSGWNLEHTECEIKGRAGVAILSRHPLSEVTTGLVAGGVAAEGAAHTGRWLEATVGSALGPIRLVSVYVHSGQAGTPKMDDKYAFLDLMTARMAELATTGHVVIMGDINIAHTERDIKNWRGNRTTAGFLPEERAYLDRWFAGGWVDVHRTLAGDVEGPYTWWSQRGRAFDTDTGWRLDYHVATPSLAALAREARVHRAPSWDTQWSDHAPLVVTYGDA